MQGENIINLYIFPIAESNSEYLDYPDYHKLILLKDEIMLLYYYHYEPGIEGFTIRIMDYNDNETLKNISTFLIDGIMINNSFYSDMLSFTDTKVIYVFIPFHGRRIYIYFFNFFEDYKKYFINEFKLNLYDFQLSEIKRYSQIFIFKDLLGIQLITFEKRTGFILFGYLNSTDPKQIYDIKKDGLNYKINLRNYLNLQSNIFGYEILGIKILKIPPFNESGLYLISNNTKNIVKENDLIELNTLISLHFSYNGIIKKGSYLFKFAGVLQEATFDEFKNLSDDFLWNNTWDLNPKDLDQKYIEIFNERRNKNITGKVALVRINVFDDIKVFCDEKYDETSLKTEDGKYLICGEGEFYEVENVNEITQKIPGINYYFDEKKNVFIK